MKFYKTGTVSFFGGKAGPFFFFFVDQNLEYARNKTQEAGCLLGSGKGSKGGSLRMWRQHTSQRLGLIRKRIAIFLCFMGVFYGWTKESFAEKSHDSYSSLTLKKEKKEDSNSNGLGVSSFPVLQRKRKEEKERNFLDSSISQPFGAEHALFPSQGKLDLTLSARFVKVKLPIQTGLHWRVFSPSQGSGGSFILFAESRESNPRFFLNRGTYVVVLSYGLVVESKTIQVKQASQKEEFFLDVGALLLKGKIGDQVLQPERLTAKIFKKEDMQSPLHQVKGGSLVILPTGRYQIVSTLGDSNANVHVDISIRPGKMTETIVNHRAALIRFRLRSFQDRIAYAQGTIWNILTPGGDMVKEVTEPSPSLILAEGEYFVVVRHEGKIYDKSLIVRSGEDAFFDIAIR